MAEGSCTDGDGDGKELRTGEGLFTLPFNFLQVTQSIETRYDSQDEKNPWATPGGPPEEYRRGYPLPFYKSNTDQMMMVPLVSGS